jgi:hypothetical protein
LELCQFHNRTNIGSNQPYKMQGVERSNHLILTKLGINLKNSGQIWNHKLGINFNYSWQTLNRWGVLMGGWGVQQHPRRNPDWKKKTPHTDQERVSLTSELCAEKYCNYVLWFVLLFRTLCQSLQCCGKTRYAWEKSVVNDFGLLLSIQLFDLILWTGS